MSEVVGHGVALSSSLASAVPLDTESFVGSGTTPSWARWVLRFVGYLAVTVIAGIVVCGLWVWPAAWTSQRVRRLAVVAVVAGVLGTVIELFIVISDIDDTLDQAIDTRIGGALATRLALFLLVGGIMGLSLLRGRTRWVAAAVVTLGLIVTWSWAGHSARGRWSGLGVVVDVVHFAAAAAWIGALIVLVTAGLRPVAAAGTEQPAAVTGRFGRLTAVAVVAVAVTGIVQAIRSTDAAEQLFEWAFGRLLIAKVVVLAVLLVWVNANRRRLARAQERQAWDSEATAGRLRQNVRRAMGTEVVLGLGLFALSAALVANPTGIHAFGAHIEANRPPEVTALDTSTTEPPEPATTAVASTEPVSTTSAGTETTEPATTEPVATEPATTESVATEPAITEPEPEPTEPATTEPEPEPTEPVTTEAPPAPTTVEPATTLPIPTGDDALPWWERLAVTATPAPTTDVPSSTAPEPTPDTSPTSTTPPAPTCTIDRELESGDRNSDVECLQTVLIERGLLDTNIDGLYGPLTEEAVVAFQESAGLIVDGVVGPNTATALGIWAP